MPTKFILLSWPSLRVNKSISREKKSRKVAIEEDMCLGDSLIWKEAIISLLEEYPACKVPLFPHDLIKRTERKQKWKFRAWWIAKIFIDDPEMY